MIDEPGASGLQGLLHPVRQHFRGNAPGLRALHDPAEAFPGKGIQLRPAAEPLQTSEGLRQEGRFHRPGADDDDLVPQKLQLHPKGGGIPIQGGLGDGIDPGEGQGIQGRQLTGDDKDPSAGAEQGKKEPVHPKGAEEVHVEIPEEVRLFLNQDSSAEPPLPF